MKDLLVHILQTHGQSKEARSEIINFCLVVYGLSPFLARRNSCRKIFGSWWLVVARRN